MTTNLDDAALACAEMDVYTNKLDRLCIINNAKQPQYTKTQEQLIADADEAIRIYRNSIKKAQEHYCA